MKRPGFLLISLGLSSVMSGCSQDDGAGGGPVEAASSSSSTSGPAVDPAASTPTTTESTGPASTGTLSTTSTSDAPDSDGSVESGSSTNAESSSGGATDGSTENCGNGVRDPGEECDDGYASNSDTVGMCTLACKRPVCGDGLVWQGYENCDSGPNNNDSLYNGCTTNCELGPHCGDSIVQDSEECDAGPANGTGESPSEDGVACESLCRFSAKLVFVTSATYSINEVDGVTGAHGLCTTLAKDAGFDSSDKFKAFISAVGFTPADHFIHSEIPYVRRDGIRVADHWNDLVVNGPNPGITIGEDGMKYEEWSVWTGSDEHGKMFIPEKTCEGWSSEDPVIKGRVGRTSTAPNGKQWANYENWGCHLSARLYCFEQ